MKKLKDFSMNKENPFAKQVIANMGECLVVKSVRGANKDESAILKAVDKDMNVLGNTAFIRNKTVDTEMFTKFFLSNFQAFFDLKPASMKVFKFILINLRPNSDEILFCMEDCMKLTGLCKVTIYRALAELCNAEIIARGWNEIQYYINPMCVFNGDRVTFATTYINKHFDGKYETTIGTLKGTIGVMRSAGDLPDPRQLEMFPELEQHSTE